MKERRKFSVVIKTIFKNRGEYIANDISLAVPVGTEFNMDDFRNHIKVIENHDGDVLLTREEMDVLLAIVTDAKWGAEWRDDENRAENALSFLSAAKERMK